VFDEVYEWSTETEIVHFARSETYSGRVEDQIIVWELEEIHNVQLTEIFRGHQINTYTGYTPEISCIIWNEGEVFSGRTQANKFELETISCFGRTSRQIYYGLSDEYLRLYEEKWIGEINMDMYGHS